MALVDISHFLFYVFLCFRTLFVFLFFSQIVCIFQRQRWDEMVRAAQFIIIIFIIHVWGDIVFFFRSFTTSFQNNVSGSTWKVKIARTKWIEWDQTPKLSLQTIAYFMNIVARAYKMCSVHTQMCSFLLISHPYIAAETVNIWIYDEAVRECAVQINFYDGENNTKNANNSLRCANKPTLFCRVCGVWGVW